MEWATWQSSFVTSEQTSSAPPFNDRVLLGWIPGVSILWRGKDSFGRDVGADVLVNPHGILVRIDPHSDAIIGHRKRCHQETGAEIAAVRPDLSGRIGQVLPRVRVERISIELLVVAVRTEETEHVP